MVTHTLKILQYLLQDLQSMPDHRKKLCIKGITGIQKNSTLSENYQIWNEMLH